MAIKSNFFRDTDNKTITETNGEISVIEYLKDLSTTPYTAMTAYFANEMNFRKRQVAIKMGGELGYTVQAGAMQWFAGNIEASSGVKGIGDLGKKFISSKVTGETAIKPEYRGNGILVLEPTYKYLIIEDLNDWGGSMTIDDGLFYVCDSRCQLKTVARRNLSSAVLGGEGLFNTSIRGTGLAVLECLCPREELITVMLKDDILKIDGNFAVAWSSNLDFTVELTTKSVLGSAASGEGFVNVYRGTGKVMMMPLAAPKADIPLPTPKVSLPLSL